MQRMIIAVTVLQLELMLNESDVDVRWMQNKTVEVKSEENGEWMVNEREGENRRGGEGRKQLGE